MFLPVLPAGHVGTATTITGLLNFSCLIMCAAHHWVEAAQFSNADTEERLEQLLVVHMGTCMPGCCSDAFAGAATEGCGVRLRLQLQDSQQARGAG